MPSRRDTNALNVLFVKELPKSNYHKVLKRRLRLMAESGAAGTVSFKPLASLRRRADLIQNNKRRCEMSRIMTAGVSSETGLQIAEVPIPVAEEGQVLVKVAAAGMNRADLNAAHGAGVATKASLGKPIGMEWAGEIVELGRSVSGLTVGQKVMCSGSGGYAEYAITDARRCMPIEDADFALTQAAVLPLVLMTAHDAVITNGRLETGEAVLVQGASSARWWIGSPNTQSHVRGRAGVLL
jgi:NADPH-dependent curcumin reductase CurA